jgi:anaerobic selenocysteine-containing dehydrogenase
MHNAARLTSGRARHHLLVNPEDLAARGIPDGSLVTVRSAAGEVQVEAAASTDLMPGVVSLPHGYGHARQGVRLARASALPCVSINDLTDPNVVDLGSGNAVLNGIPVTITASSDEG